MTGSNHGWLDTINSGKVYKKPNRVDTPHQQNAEEVVHAIHHFSHILTVWRYDGTIYDEGHHYEGEKVIFQIYGELQYDLPGNQETSNREKEHVYSSGSAKFYYDPYYQKNLEANEGNPVYLRTADSRYITAQGGPVDDIKCGAADELLTGENSGRLQIFKVEDHIEFPSSSNEETQGVEGGYCMAVLSLHRSHHHYRLSDRKTIESNDGNEDMGGYIGEV